MRIQAIPQHPHPTPTPPRLCRQSISVIREIMESRMYPITIEGLERAMRYLSK